MGKSILIFNTSPRKGGNTETIAGAFAGGAREAGHDVHIFNTDRMDIGACRGCTHCAGSPCILKDGMQEIYDLWDEADAVVFASPVYWMQMNGQFAVLRDRLCAVASHRKKKKDMYLILTSAVMPEQLYHMPVEYYEYLVGVFKYTDRGRILAGGLHDVGEAQKSRYIALAREMGLGV